MATILAIVSPRPRGDLQGGRAPPCSYNMGFLLAGDALFDFSY